MLLYPTTTKDIFVSYGTHCYRKQPRIPPRHTNLPLRSYEHINKRRGQRWKGGGEVWEGDMTSYFVFLAASFWSPGNRAAARPALATTAQGGEGLGRAHVPRGFGHLELFGQLVGIPEEKKKTWFNHKQTQFKGRTPKVIGFLTLLVLYLFPF